MSYGHLLQQFSQHGLLRLCWKSLLPSLVVLWLETGPCPTDAFIMSLLFQSSLLALFSGYIIICIHNNTVLLYLRHILPYLCITSDLSQHIFFFLRVFQFQRCIYCWSNFVFSLTMFHHLNSLYSIFLLLNYHLSSLVSAPVLVCERRIIIIITIILVRSPAGSTL